VRSLRGLYVIRGGGATPRLSAPVASRSARAADAPDDGRLATLEVDFSKFDTWYRIDSWWEGTFMERTVRGAFARTIKNNGPNVKVLFNHGFDMSIGDKVLGVPEVLEERADSPHLEAGLLDTSYNRDLLPGLRAGAYGSSFMFEVLGESWNREPGVSDHNPEGLPERSVTEVRLHEAGPVTWPANPAATAGVRSGMDWYAEQVQLRRDREQLDELARLFTAFRALHGLGDVGASTTSSATEPKTSAPGEEDPARHVDGVSATARRRRLSLIGMAKG
jgi:HK97 family phage prohead protease